MMMRSKAGDCGHGLSVPGRLFRWHEAILAPSLFFPRPVLHSSIIAIMSPTSPENLARANYQSIFDSALLEYKKKTRKDLSSNPLCHKLQSCSSPDDIIIILRQQIPGFDQSASASSEDRLTKWLDPTVKVISAFSATIGGAVALVSLSVY
jgi:hypothetical protein